MKKLSLLILFVLISNFIAFAQTANTLLDSTFMFCSQITTHQHSLPNIPTPTPRDFNKVLVLPDDKILVSGAFKATLNVVLHSYLIKLNSDGSIDSSFQYFVGDNRIVTKVIPLSGGKFLVAGDRRIHRIHADGSEDTTFNSLDFSISALDGLGNPAGNSHIRDIALMPNGNILVGGEFLTFDSDSVFHLVELNPDGTLNNLRNSPFLGTAPGSIVRFVMPLTDGRFIASANGNGVFVFKSNGDLDTTATVAVGISFSTFKMLMQPDGKIIMARERGGAFTSLGGGTIARFNSDFTFDSTFTPVLIPTSGNQDVVKNIKLFGDGKIGVVGSFSEVNNTPYRRMVRLNSDGSIDNSFNPGSDAFSGGGTLYDVDLQSDGKIILVHSHTNHNGIILTNNNVPCFVIRLNGDNGGGSGNNPPTAPSNLTATATNSIELNWQDNANNEDGFYIENALNAADPWSVIDTVAVNSTSYLHTGLSEGVEYFYRVKAFNADGVSVGSNVASAVNQTSSLNLFWQDKIKIFPNPASDFVNIENVLQNSILRIFSPHGILIKEQVIQKNKESIGLTEMATGIYFLQIENDGHAVNFKLLIAK